MKYIHTIIRCAVYSCIVCEVCVSCVCVCLLCVFSAHSSSFLEVFQLDRDDSSVTRSKACLETLSNYSVFVFDHSLFLQYKNMKKRSGDIPSARSAGPASR